MSHQKYIGSLKGISTIDINEDRDIEFYVKRAMEHTGVDSYRKLCKILEIAPNAINGYLKKGCLPSDRTMTRLAMLAGINPMVAGIDLNIWRTKDTEREYYKAIRTQIATKSKESEKMHLDILKRTSNAILILISFSSLLFSSPADPVQTKNIDTLTIAVLYIITQKYG